MTYPTPLSRIAAGFNDGSVSALKLADTALARIHDEGFAPGAQIFTRVYDASARAEALAADHRRAAGLSQGPLACSCVPTHDPQLMHLSPVCIQPA